MRIFVFLKNDKNRSVSSSPLPGILFFMNLSTKQQLFIERALNGENIFLHGKAGTGKSTVVRELISRLKNKKFVALAPTGIAANNINGQTIHSFFALSPFGVLTFGDCNFVKSEKRRLWNSLDIIFMDEVSMLRPDTLDAINWTLIKNGCKSLKEFQIIFVGDLKQLPATLDDNTKSVLFQTYNGEEFYNAKIYRSILPVEIELDEIQRQSDAEFITALNIVREGGKSDYFKQFLSADYHGIVLAPHNATVNKYNIEGLKQLPGQEIIFRAEVSGKAKCEDFNMESIISVKNGAKIMYLVNSKEDSHLINGTLGTFVHRKPSDKIGRKNKQPVDIDLYFINVNGIEYPLNYVTHSKKQYVLNESKDELELQEMGTITQIPIRLAYALTIHKSMGLTFDEITIDLSIPCFASGQLYTALSRVKTPGGLKIIVNR